MGLKGYFMKVRIESDRMGSLQGSAVSEKQQKALEEAFGTSDAFAQEGMQLWYDVWDKLSDGARADIQAGWGATVNYPIDEYWHWVEFHRTEDSHYKNPKGNPRKNARLVEQDPKWETEGDWYSVTVFDGYVETDQHYKGHRLRVEEFWRRGQGGGWELYVDGEKRGELRGSNHKWWDAAVEAEKLVDAEDAAVARHGEEVYGRAERSHKGNPLPSGEADLDDWFLLSQYSMDATDDAPYPDRAARVYADEGGFTVLLGRLHGPGFPRRNGGYRRGHGRFVADWGHRRLSKGDALAIRSDWVEGEPFGERGEWLTRDEWDEARQRPTWDHTTSSRSLTKNPISIGDDPDNMPYSYYVVIKATGGVLSGWDYKEDAQEDRDELVEEGGWKKSDLSVMTLKGIDQKWGRLHWVERLAQNP